MREALVVITVYMRGLALLRVLSDLPLSVDSDDLEKKLHVDDWRQKQRPNSFDFESQDDDHRSLL